jgi:hypothetical protein
MRWSEKMIFIFEKFDLRDLLEIVIKKRLIKLKYNNLKYDIYNVKNYK